jgi:hypothetical protein
MIVFRFSGIPNGEFSQRPYGLRFVGHDSSVALVADRKGRVCRRRRAVRAREAHLEANLGQP